MGWKHVPASVGLQKVARLRPARSVATATPRPWQSVGGARTSPLAPARPLILPEVLAATSGIHGVALAPAQVLALQRSAGNAAVASLLSARPGTIVQRTELTLVNGRTIGDTPSASNRRADLQQVLDRLHVLWSIDNESYNRQVTALQGDPVGAELLGPLGHALERNSEGSVAPPVAQTVLGVAIRSAVGPGQPNLANDVRILYTVLHEEGLAPGANDDASRLSAAETGLSELKRRIVSGRRAMQPSAGSAGAAPHVRARGKPLSAGLVTLTDAERHQVDTAGPGGFAGLPSAVQGKVQVEKTLMRAGVPDVHSWFDGFVECSFLGNTTADGRGVHPDLQGRLEAAEDALLADAEAASYGIHLSDKLRGWRSPPDGPHSFGLAVDINYETNPAITGPTKRAVAHAGLLLRHVPEAENPINTQSGLAAPGSSWGMLRQASDDFVRYIGLVDHPEDLAKAVASLQAVGLNPGNRTAAEWATQIRADHRAAETDFRMSGGDLRDMSRGFLDLDQRVVRALTRQGLTWLGDFAGYQDIQHFAYSHGSVRRIWKEFDSHGSDVFNPQMV